MEEMKSGARLILGWYSFVLAYYARETWRALPGPWYVKVLLIVICSLIPGPADEIALIAVTAYARRRASHLRAS